MGRIGTAGANRDSDMGQSKNHIKAINIQNISNLESNFLKKLSYFLKKCVFLKNVIIT